MYPPLGSVLIFCAVFKSDFSETEQSTANGRHRRIINIPDSADLFHAILYHAYTNQITFTTDTEMCQGPSTIYLDRVEEFYALAQRLVLKGLEYKALEFLKDTCCIENITARAFGKFGDKFGDVGKVYTEFLLDHWDEVVLTSNFESFFKEAEEDPNELQRVNGVFRRLVQSRARDEMSRDGQEDKKKI
jgi:hypothetical protein